MGLFSHKPEVLTEARNPFGIGTVTLNAKGKIVGEVSFGSCMLDGDAESEVVGESHYRETLLELIAEADYDDPDWARAGRIRESFALVPEPSNTYDSNAVAVTTVFGDKVGYLPRAFAERVQPILLDLLRGGATQFTCVGVVLWPADKGDPELDDSVPVGVRLDLFDDFSLPQSD